jgi:hypothetical protein
MAVSARKMPADREPEPAPSAIEYTSLINIRPTQGNRGMLIADLGLRAKVQEITFALIGEGEPLP